MCGVGMGCCDGVLWGLMRRWDVWSDGVGGYRVWSLPFHIAVQRVV